MWQFQFQCRHYFIAKQKQVQINDTRCIVHFRFAIPPHLALNVQQVLEQFPRGEFRLNGRYRIHKRTGAGRAIFRCGLAEIRKRNNAAAWGLLQFFKSESQRGLALAEI